MTNKEIELKLEILYEKTLRLNFLITWNGKITKNL
jgi:hypothetical protein